MNSSGDITLWVVPSRQGGLELEHHLPRGVCLYALVGQRRARDVAAELFQPLAVVGAAAHRSVQGEAGHKGPEGALCLPNASRRYKPVG